MQHSKSQNSTPQGIEILKVEDHNIKIETADILENAGRTIRNANLSIQGDDVSRLINTIEGQISQFKEASGLTFEPVYAGIHGSSSSVTTVFAGQSKTIQPIIDSSIDSQKISEPVMNHPFGSQKLRDSVYQPYLGNSR